MQDNEKFYPIKGFEGYYEINRNGQIRSTDRRVRYKTNDTRQHKGRIIKTFLDKDGYPRVSLAKQNNKKSFIPVHRLVAIAFIPNPENKPQVNHIDSNRRNFSINNLEWNTGAENQQHKYKNGYTSKSRKMSESVVIDIYTNTVVGKKGEIVKMIRKHGVSKIMVIQLIYNRTYLDITKNLVQPIG